MKVHPKDFGQDAPGYSEVSQKNEFRVVSFVESWGLLSFLPQLGETMGRSRGGGQNSWVIIAGGICDPQLLALLRPSHLLLH